MNTEDERHEIIRAWCLEKKEWLLKESANVITYIGLIFTIAIPVTAMIDPKRLWSMTLFAVISGVSDLLDGLIARKLEAESLFGSALDRLRDKVFIIPNLIILIWIYRDSILVFYKTTVTLICTIIFIESLLFIMGWIVASKKIKAEANKLGQIKMFILFPVVIIWLTSLAIQASFDIPIMKFSIPFILFMFFISGFLGILSMGKYFKAYFREDSKKEAQ